jgi:hypothetical protein
VIASTPATADRIAASTDIRSVVVADAAGLVELQLAELARTATPDARTGRRVRVGYVSETVSDQADLHLLSPTLADLLDRHQHVEVVVVGPLQLGAALLRFGARVERLDTPDWQGVFALMRDIDINLSPAPTDSSGHDGSLRSWLNASLVEVATVASTSGAAADVVEHRRTGLLCASLDERRAALDRLVTDDALRARLGAAARRDVELHHSPHVTARHYRDAFDVLDHRDPADRPLAPATPSAGAVAPPASSVVPLAPYDLGDAIIGDAAVGDAVVGDASAVAGGTGGGVRVRRRVGRLVGRVRHLVGRVRHG